MKRTIVFALIVFGIAAANSASADTIRGIDIDFATIGHAGNAGDTRPEANPYGCGAVGYNYRIGKYEVTNAQWNTFVDAAGTPTGNDGGYTSPSYYTDAQQPTNRVSWYEAAQFCNYLTSGDKSQGVYQFSGNNANPGDFLGINRDAAISSYGIVYVIPTEDEWYKAAYLKPDGSGYSLYANGTSTAPTAGVNSNYDSVIGLPWDIGTGTQEQNGTFDMMGNVWEWNESLYPDGSARILRGGSYYNYGFDVSLASSFQHGVSPYYEYNEYSSDVGFRIASIPEPTSAILIGVGCLFARSRRRRR
jgi:formylglycine-generating enzyme required for sulfatase activity